MIENKLKKHFRFDNFLKGQKEVIEMILAGEPAVAIFPTGGGKSLCYQLPALFLPGITLVVSPLLSLMKDQLDFLSRKNIPAAKLDSTMDREEYNNVLKKARDGSLKILMISVERFKNERFRIQLKGIRISLLVVDEAHCISEWGHNFRPEYLKIPFYKEEFKINQILLLTATAAPRVRDDMCAKFNVPEQNVVITGFYRKNLFLQVSPVCEDEKDSRLLSRVNENADAATIVYVTLQKTAEKVAGMLNSNGVNAMSYHAGLQNDERVEIQNKFMGGKVPVVVATIAFGMGIDKKDIRRVLHYDLPKSIEGYSQEIGRAGR
ncbi:MAG: RecQ family ATP-dependent DNA helicase, partial [Candidatus Omnitrophica bacterium]|nr:RecQ family ATP-dependent DNA helicase [Candidatus Omnitrophota bacterium]